MKQKGFFSPCGAGMGDKGRRGIVTRGPKPSMQRKTWSWTMGYLTFILLRRHPWHATRTAERFGGVGWPPSGDDRLDAGPALPASPAGRIGTRFDPRLLLMGPLPSLSRRINRREMWLRKRILGHLLDCSCAAGRLLAQSLGRASIGVSRVEYVRSVVTMCVCHPAQSIPFA